MMKIYTALQKTFCFFMFAAIVLILLMDGYALAALAVVSIIYALRSKQIPHFTSLLFLVGVASRIVIMLLLHPPVISDFEVMYDSACAISMGDYSFQNTPYFSLWAYQTLFTAWEAAWLSLWDSIACLKLVNAIMGSATVVLIYRTARSYVSENAAQVAAILLTLQPFELTHHLILSNQPSSALFLVCGVWILISNDCRRLGVWRFPLSGLIFQFGNLLRCEGVIILCALFAWTVFELVRHPQYAKRILLCILSLFAVYMTVGKAADSIVKASGLNSYGLRNSYPSWKFITGTNYNTKGTFSPDDWARIFVTLDENYQPTEATAATQKEIFSEHLKSPKHLVKLMLNKIKAQWCMDNLYWSFSHTVKDHPNDSFGVFTRQETLTILQQYNLGLMFAAILLSAIGLRRREGWTSAAYIPYFAFFAAFCAFLLIEVQPRYVYLPQQFIFCSAAFGTESLFRTLKKVNSECCNEESNSLAG